MATRAQDVAGAAFGIAGAGLVGYLLYREWQKTRLVREFMEKVQRFEAAYKSAVERGDHEGATALSETYWKLMKEEEEIIKDAGALEKLLYAVLAIVIAVPAGKIAVAVVKAIISKYRPPRFPCGTCGKSFPTEHTLDTHIRTEHAFQPDRVPQAEIDYSTLSDFWKNLLEAVSGVPRRVLEQSWSRIPPWVLVAVAIGAIVIIVATWGKAAVLFKGIAAMVKWAPVPA